MQIPESFSSADNLFAFGRCMGEEWTLLHCNAVLEALFAAKEGGAGPGELVGRGLGDLMREAGLEPVFDALARSEPGVNTVFHCRDTLFIFRWQYGDEASGQGAQGERLFLLHAVPLHYSRGDSGLWREVNALFDSLHDGIWLTDQNGITLKVNKALEDMTGIPASELEGRHVTQPIKQGRYQASMTLRALEEGRKISMLDYYDNGKCFLNTSTPVFDDAGNVWRVIACIRDMTALEAIQNRLVDLEIDTRKQKSRLRGKDDYTAEQFVGSSDALRRVVQDIGKAARSEAIVLILGETGTGKTLAAQTVHSMSPRRKEPFITVNCGALPGTLIESELFGYEKGAFTGARTSGKIGLFEAAAGGTIFLDEITEMPVQLQAKLLHVLDGHSFTRVGGVKPIKLRARVVAATNRPLEETVKAGNFREDLYYRLNVLTVRIPPLRERVADLPDLARYFLAEANEKNAMHKALRPEVLRRFAEYPWPGNVRELRAIIEYLVAMSESNHISLRDLPDALRMFETGSSLPGDEPLDLKAALAKTEKQLIARALQETGSTWKAAKRLKISQASVVRKARRYSIGVNAVVHK